MLERQEEVSDVEVVLKRDCPGGNPAAIASHVDSHELAILEVAEHEERQQLLKLAARWGR